MQVIKMNVDRMRIELKNLKNKRKASNQWDPEEIIETLIEIYFLSLVEKYYLTKSNPR